MASKEVRAEDSQMLTQEIDSSDEFVSAASSSAPATPAISGPSEAYLAEDLSPRALRRNHLVTLTQADPLQFPDETSFAAAMTEAFLQCQREVPQWACCQELHDDGGIHYHYVASIGGKACKRYEPVVEKFKELNRGAVVKFTKGCSGGYARGYNYITKEGMGSVVHSPGHPNLEQIYARGKRSQKCRDKLTEEAEAKKKRRTASPAPSGSKQATSKQAASKPPRLTMPEVGDFVLRNNISNYASLEGIAYERRVNGDYDLFNFLCRTRKTTTEELIVKMVSMRDIPKRQEEDSLTKMDKLHRAGQGDCVDSCDGKWRRYATEILAINNIDLNEFTASFKQALTVGRGKAINPMLTGITDCGKSFLVEPLEEIYRCFTSPAEGKFTWVELERKEVVILNDLRWSQELIAWDAFLRFLEGGTVQFTRPANLFNSPLLIDRSNDMAIFATGINEISYPGNKGETDMMKLRWKVFTFDTQVPRDKVDRKCQPCPRCFHDFVMNIAV